MDFQQILWGATSILVVIVGFFTRMWIAETREALKTKLEASICVERNGRLERDLTVLFRHKHASTGEVIIP